MPDPSPFVSELEDAVRFVETLWPSLRGIERTAAIAHVRVSQLSRASNLECPAATTSVSHMQRLLNKAGLNMPVVHQRSEPAPDSQTARSDSFEDQVRMLYVDSQALCRAAAAFCRSVESLRADARLWSATEAIAIPCPDRRRNGVKPERCHRFCKSECAALSTFCDIKHGAPFSK